MTIIRMPDPGERWSVAHYGVLLVVRNDGWNVLCFSEKHRTHWTISMGMFLKGPPDVECLSGHGALVQDGEFELPALPDTALRSAVKSAIHHLLPVSDCQCQECEKLICNALARRWACSFCGYDGAPNAQEMDGGSRVLVCPVCDSGERELTDVLITAARMLKNALEERNDAGA